MERGAALLGVIGGVTALSGQEAPRFERTLGAALATSDLQDRSRTERPVFVRTPSGTVQTAETVEVTRNALAPGP